MASSWPRYRSLNSSQGRIAPYISIQPKTEGIAVAIGKRAVLEASIISQMPVTLQWSKNDNIISRATNYIFEIPSVTLLDEGYYQLTATLADGRSVFTVLSIAISKPEIVKQPQGGQFQEGPNFFISIDANGYFIKYQWKLDGVDLPDATNSFLKFSALRLTDKGKYTVTVSNPIGSVLSEPAAIIVSRLPVGNMYWEFLTGGHVSSSPAIGSDGTLYVGGGRHKVYAMNGATGVKKWEFLTGDAVRSSPAIGSDGRVYVGSGDGKVYAIASSSEGLVKSPWPKFKADNSNTGKIAAGFGPLGINYYPQSGLNLDIPVSPDFDTILEYSTNLNQWSEQQRFGRQSNVPSIVVPLKMDQTKSMEYWRTRNQ